MPDRPPADGAWQRVDRAYADLLTGYEADDRWLLEQTIVSAPSRRAVHGLLPLPAGATVLDLGSGFGVVAQELAASTGCRAVGLDVDVDRLRRAAGLAEAIAATTDPGGSTPGPVRFAGGDCTRLPFRAGSFDAATARYLLQYFPDPVAVFRELARVIRPGGVVCVIDVDDAFSVTHPELPAPVPRLMEAFADLQRARGGDRQVGRKLPGALDAAGFQVASIQLVSQAGYGASSPGDLSRRFLLRRLEPAAAEIVERGLATEHEIGQALEVLRRVHLPPMTAIEAQLAVLPRRR